MLNYKKALFILISTLSLTTANAKVITLNNHDATKCRQQILNAKDNYPIVVVYSNTCPCADIFLPIYQDASNNFTKRDFFTYDFANEKSFATFRHCILRNEEVSPDTIIMKKTDSSYKIIRHKEGIITADELATLISSK